MNIDNNIDKDVKQVLDTLTEHSRDIRQQRQLSDLIDQLAASEQKPKKTIVFSWKYAVGIAASLLLLFTIMPKRNNDPTDNISDPHNEVIAMQDETDNIVSLPTEEIPAVLVEESIPVPNTALAVTEKKAAKKVKTVVTEPVETVSPSEEVLLVEEEPCSLPVSDDILLAQADGNLQESIETPEITDIEEIQSSRRTIQSTSLVTQGNTITVRPRRPKRQKHTEDKTLFGQPQSSHIFDGTLAMTINCNHLF